MEPDKKEEEKLKASIETPTNGRRTNTNYKVIEKK